MSDNKNKDGSYGQLTGIHRAIPIILVAVAIFIATCFITKNTGVLGVALGGFLLGCFSIGGYLIPALFAVHAFFYSSDIQKKRLLSRVIFSILLIIAVSALAHAVYSARNGLEFSVSQFYALGKEGKGGGFIGGIIAYGLITIIDYVGLIILSVMFFAIYATYFFSGEKNLIGRAFKKLIYKFVIFGAKTERRLADKKKKKKLEKEKLRAEKKEAARKRLEEKKASKNLAPTKDSDLYDDEFFAVDNGLSELKIEELGINESRRREDIEKNPTLQEKVFPKGRIRNDIEEDEPFAGRTVNTDYGFETPEYTVKEEGGDIILEDIPKGEARMAQTDESAESIFAADFAPFDFAMNEKLAAKQSSAPLGAKVPPSVKEFAETVTPTFTEAEINAARRKAEFEAKKSQLVNEERERQYREAEEKAEARSAEIDIEAILGMEVPSVPEAPRSYAEEYENTAPVRSETVENEAATAEAKVEDISNYGTNYRRAAEYARTINLHREEAPKKAEEPLFKQFTPPAAEPAAYASAPGQTPEQTLTISRTPIVEEPAEKENDDTLLVFSGDTGTAIAADGDATVTEDDISELLKGFTAPSQSEDSVFEFDDGEDEDEEITLPEGGDGEDEGGLAFEFGDEIPPEKQNPEVSELRKMFDIFSEVEVAPTEDEPEPIEAAEAGFKGGDVDAYEDAIDAFNEEDEELPPFDIPASPVTKPIQKTVSQAPVYEKPDYSSFKFPPIDLLAKGQDTEDESISEETNETGARLIDALLQFDVRASIKGVDRGPRITRYEVVPARGVRVSKVIGLFDDIALNLAAEGIRMEAPIPGKSAIGVEIPNKHPATVMLRDLIESDEFTSESSKTFACVGKDVTGNPVFGDIAKMPHILVAGATGMGKSVCINSILVSILYKARPDEVKFIMVDPKTVEFTMYNGIPHLLIPVVTDVKQAAGALMWAIDEMNKRYELMAKHEVRKLDSYNDLVRANPELGEPLPKIIIVIDELNDLMQQVRKPVEGLITNITQKARAAGIHMIIGTQRPSVDVITGVIKANIPSRISCKVTALTDSRTILDQAGAEKLLDKGDMLFAPVGKPKPIRVQGAFVSDAEVEKIMKFLKSNVKGSVYDQQALEEINRAAQKCSKGKEEDDFDDDDDGEEGVGYLNDKQFLDAVDLAIKQGKISTSLIQRKISIGYGKAAKFIDIMEDMGIVSEPNGQKPRDVLVSRDEWQEMLSRRSLDD